jgi:hypothetical protein
MIIKRTCVLYLLTAIILFKITDVESVHVRRLDRLVSQNKYFYENNVNVAIDDWNYRRRLDPNNIAALKSLGKYYLLANDNALARKTIHDFLCIAPQHDKDRPDFLRAYVALAGDDKVDCKKGFIDDFISTYVRF